MKGSVAKSGVSGIIRRDKDPKITDKKVDTKKKPLKH